MTPNGKPTRKRRPSFSDEELRGFHLCLGAEIGRRQAIGILENATAREIADDTKELLALQDKILEALNNEEQEKEL